MVGDSQMLKVESKFLLLMPHLQLQQFGLQNRSQSPLPKFGQIFIADHISDACKAQVTVDE